MTAQLGKLTPITDLREIWPHEARDFSTWLSKEENLKELGDAIGIDDIVFLERESSIGDFNVDLFVIEEGGSGRKIIIENQLTDTNHDHLGKIITYAAGKGADVIVWIVKEPGTGIGRLSDGLTSARMKTLVFFLIEIKLWKIGNSQATPRFNVVEKPNDWVKTIGSKEV